MQRLTDTGQCRNCLSDMNRAKDSTCTESFKKGQGLLKSIPERCDPKKTHKNKKDYRKVVLVGGECRSTDTGGCQREENNRLAP